MWAANNGAQNCKTKNFVYTNDKPSTIAIEVFWILMKKEIEYLLWISI